MDLVFKFDGTDARGYFRPPLLGYASTLARSEALAGGKADVQTAARADCLPLPSGMRPSRRAKDGAPLLSVSEAHALRFRRFYGNVGEIRCIKDGHEDEISVDSPASVAVIVNLSRRYGSLREELHDSWAYCLLWAFTSTALCDFSTHVLVTPYPA